MTSELQTRLERLRQLEAEVAELKEGLFDEGTEYYIKVRVTEQGYDADDDTVNVETADDRSNEFWADAADLIPVEQVETRRPGVSEIAVRDGDQVKLAMRAIRQFKHNDRVQVALVGRVLGSPGRNGDITVRLDEDQDGDSYLYSLAPDTLVVAAPQ
jgi:hypothetical protein